MEEKWLLSFDFLCVVCIPGRVCLFTHPWPQQGSPEGEEVKCGLLVSFPRFPHLLLLLVSPSSSLTIVLLTLVQPHGLDRSPPKICSSLCQDLYSTFDCFTYIAHLDFASGVGWGPHVPGKGFFSTPLCPVWVFSAGALCLGGTEVWVPWAASLCAEQWNGAAGRDEPKWGLSSLLGILMVSSITSMISEKFAAIHLESKTTFRGINDA